MVASAGSARRARCGSAAHCALLAAALILPTGCSRAFYRVRADRDAYGIVAEKSLETPWEPPTGYDVIPDPRSRLFDPSPIDDPWLPVPAPRLYEYRIPDLPPHHALQPIESRLEPQPAPPTLPAADPASAKAPPAILRISHTRESTSGDRSALAKVNLATPTAPEKEGGFAGALKVAIPSVAGARNGQNVPKARTSNIHQAQGLQPEQPPVSDAGLQDIQVSPITIPPSAWESIPQKCLIRALEFENLRDEYARTYGRAPTAEERDAAPRLALAQIVDLALLNSREYQTAKEQLYRAALRLTLERFQYDLKFSAAPGTNRAAIDYRHTRTQADGTTNTLSFPSTLQADKVLLTGGDLLARLANDIVLTFDGPQGFTADLSSELFVSLSQTVLQRDIRFEALTRGERNVVYAARDFARFRKEIFNQLAGQYYGLLRTYRQVEIDSLNYFTLVRALTQRREEFRVGWTARVQVDQIEQNVLSGLIALIGTCNRLESDLDSLKLRIGLPTETRINLDLAELERLTLADEVAVSAELVQRIRERLQTAAGESEPDRFELLNLAVELLARMQDSLTHAQSMQPDDVAGADLAVLQARLQVDQARLAVRERRSALAADMADPAAPPVRLAYRHFEIVNALLSLLDRQRMLAERRALPQSATESLEAARMRLSTRAVELQGRLDAAIDQLQLDQVGPIVEAARELSAEAEQAVADGDRVLGIDADDPPGGQAAEQALAEVQRLLESSGRFLEQFGAGLVPVQIGVDEAMLTALVLRLGLMNQRGFLADEWRQVKLAADELKSILNLSTSHTLEDFNFEESETRLRLTFDAPLNRRAQRNAFREALINYQASRRDLMELEDLIKFAVRNDLRDLDLSRQQYELGVASAALAFERVAGTRLQLQLGVAGVQARDFLEAQTAYAAALSVVAARHLGYIVSRTQLFLDLELLQVDETGYWPQIHDLEYQPEPQYQPPWAAFPPYGQLPPEVHYSRKMRRMLQVPFGEATIFNQPAPDTGSP